MEKRQFHSRRKEMLKDGTDEQLRILRLSIANELESRLVKVDKKFFKNLPSGVYTVPKLGWAHKQ